MAVKIRLRRMGQIHAPYYRVIVADSRSPRNGKEPTVFKVDAEETKKWLQNGAQPTETVARLLKKFDI